MNKWENKWGNYFKDFTLNFGKFGKVLDPDKIKEYSFHEMLGHFITNIPKNQLASVQPIERHSSLIFYLDHVNNYDDRDLDRIQKK